MALEDFKAPVLPLAPGGYDPTYFNRVMQLLRLYFNQLDSDAAHRAFTYRGNGYLLTNPHIAASDSTDQYAGGDNVATLVAWDTLETGYGFTLNPGGYAVADHSGVCKIDFRLQFTNSDNVAHDAFVWLEVNGGTQVEDSASRFTVPPRKSVGNNGYVVAYSSITFVVTAGDAIRLYWATEKAYNTTGPVDGVFMEHLAPQVSPYARPEVPSAFGTISFLSAPV
jgi:hypothetical protein